MKALLNELDFVKPMQQSPPKKGTIPGPNSIKVLGLNALVVLLVADSHSLQKGQSASAASAENKWLQCRHVIIGPDSPYDADSLILQYGHGQVLEARLDSFPQWLQVTSTAGSSETIVTPSPQCGQAELPGCWM